VTGIIVPLPVSEF